MMRNDRGYTYLLSNGRAYKIGITTTTVTKRVAELQTGSPGKIEISGYCYNKNALDMEQYLHNRYASKRLEGEWFDLSDDDVASIHHHFETHYLDEYFAPLSERGVKVTEREQKRLSEERIIRDLKDFKTYKRNRYIALFLIGLLIGAFTSIVNGLMLAFLASLLFTYYADKLWKRNKESSANNINRKSSNDEAIKTIKLITKTIRKIIR